MIWVIITAAALAGVYGIYQILRNEKVFQIRVSWIENRDTRRQEYTYGEMFNPTMHNLFGLKFPNEKDFPHKEGLS